MNVFATFAMPLAAAADATGARTDWEFGRDGWQPLVVGFVVLILLVSWVYRRDTAQLSWFWKLWLLGLRVATLAALLFVALDPQERTETKTTRPSRVALMVDASVSMSFPEKTPTSASQPAVTADSRAEATRKLLASSDLISTLQNTHDVAVYSFDSKLKEHAVLPHRATATVKTAPKPPRIPGTALVVPDVSAIALGGGGLAAVAAILGAFFALRRRPAATAMIVLACLFGVVTAIVAVAAQGAHAEYAARMQEFQKSQTVIAEGPADTAQPGVTVDWAEVTRPAGLETRLGESLLQLIREASGETLSGVVVISDGGNNAGIETTTAHEAAVNSKVRLVTVGAGSTDRPINLQLASVQAPTHVHLGDGFSLTAFVQGQGFAGRSVHVELLSKLEKDDGPLAVVQTQEVTLLEDGIPAAATFNYLPTESGRRIFNVRVRPVTDVRELTVVDNEKPLPPVEVVERKTKVLIIAGGPMRDYQFVRNVLHRDESIELDVWLQTGSVGISQESNALVFEFPQTREELFKYDVIVAFDPDWKRISPEGRGMLSEWVFQQAGGMILIAGDVYTPELAQAKDELKLVQSLYPVVLNANLFDYAFNSEQFQQPWALEFTREGLEAEFLQLNEKSVDPVPVWNQFAGLFRCYPTGGQKAAATVYAYFSDPRSIDENGKPIVMASQFFGSGRTLYLGSAEMWRLRAIGEEYYDRFWVKCLREVGQGRLLRGTNRGVLLLERSTYPLGTTVQVRATLLDPQFKELIADRVELEVFDPSGRPLATTVPLIGHKSRPGSFQGAFSANLPGRYRLQLPIPESDEQVVQYLQVELPNLEYDRPEQDEGTLRRLATSELGGTYLTLDNAAAALPALLPDRSTTKIQFDVPRTLWDQAWVMYLLVGLLSLEWLTRKLLKLA